MKNIFTFVTLCLINVYSLKSQDIDFQKLVTDIQKSKFELTESSVIMYLAPEYWEAIFSKQNIFSAQERKDFNTWIKPYAIFAVVDARLNSMNKYTFQSYDQILKTITMTDRNGNIYKPMDNKSVDPDLLLTLEGFKPIFKNMLGEFGENFNFFVFTDLNSKNERIFDPIKKGSFQMSFNSKSFVWKTPFSSLVPNKTCPNDGEKLDGSWEFCPWHGDKLK